MRSIQTQLIRTKWLYLINSTKTFFFIHEESVVKEMYSYQTQIHTHMLDYNRPQTKYTFKLSPHTILSHFRHMSCTHCITHHTKNKPVLIQWHWHKLAVSTCEWSEENWKAYQEISLVTRWRRWKRDKEKKKC